MDRHAESEFTPRRAWFLRMTLVVHLLLFLLSVAVIWFLSGRLVESVDRVARRFKQSGFTVAFFVLGFLTSIGELSVMVNSLISGAPQVSVGNLAGASIVLLLLLVPMLAVLGNGVHLKNTLNRTQLALALFAAALPTLLLLDGGATRTEGLACVLAYGTLLYFIRTRNQASVPEVIEEVREELLDPHHATAHHSSLMDGLNIGGGGLLIFLAGNLLVSETIYLSELLGIPSSIIGLLVLSIGTNIPELVIAFRSIHKGVKGIAFGNYIGSALTNTLIFGVLALLSGSFPVAGTGFIFTGITMGVGFTAFYVFAVSHEKMSKSEGIALLCVYGAFVAFQLLTIFSD